MSVIPRASKIPASKLVAVYYVITIALGSLVLLFHGKLALAVDLIAVVFYLGVTALFYEFSERIAHRAGVARRNRFGIR
jgi:ABC-type transport system involved in cytochrome bd biosynthesis fused ATPase/permease subunit